MKVSEALPDAEYCPESRHVDGKKHSWKWDGDAPRIICHYCDEMRDALTGRTITPGKHHRTAEPVRDDAALAVAPDPAPDSEPRSCATCNGTGSLWNGGVESGTCPICEGKGNDPAPDDAFAGAVSRFGVLAEDVGTVRTSIWSRLPESEKGREAPPELVAAIEERESARQRILVLHAQAKHAGLWELRAEIDKARARQEGNDPWQIGFRFACNEHIRRIETMLKEATDE